METLFSTVAQISFTIVGLFFLALTVDSHSRDFWLGDKGFNKYVTVNFFILLLPGLISLGWLIPFTLFEFPAWLYIVSFLFVAYSYVYFELRKFYKSSGYQQISHYESAVDAKGALKFGIAGLGVMTFFGFLPSTMIQEIQDCLMGALGVFMFLLVFASVVPVYVFLRKGAEHKFDRNNFEKMSTAEAARKNGDSGVSSAKGIKYVIVLLGLLISFILGIIVSRD